MTEYCSVVKEIDHWHATTWINLQRNSDEQNSSQYQNVAYCMIQFIKHAWNENVLEMRGQICGFQRIGLGEERCRRQMELSVPRTTSHPRLIRQKLGTQPCLCFSCHHLQTSHQFLFFPSWIYLNPLLITNVHSRECCPSYCAIKLLTCLHNYPVSRNSTQ